MSLTRPALIPWQASLPLLAVMAFSSPLAAQITSREDAVGRQLNEWFRSGQAAGLRALTYENRDAGHSALNAAEYPQLNVFQHDVQSGPPTGPATQLRRSPTVGNCSMAASATQGGSLPRFYQMDPEGAKFLMHQYLANNLMIYPEHQDHDIGANGIGGYGDLYPANSCCTLISQGSSYSDLPFLKAVLSTIAAFPPKTQDLLIEKRVLMPTVQSLLRQSNKQVRQPLDYFSGIAHPVVFDSAQLDEEKMIRLAHDMTPAKIPPLAQIQVREETALVAGRDFCEDAKQHAHHLADTPVSVARVLRGSQEEYGLVLDVSRCADLLKRPIKIIFQLLQGDPQLIRLDYTGRSPYARLRVRWHPPMITATGIRSHRVDVGVFVSNGISVSAPAILSFYMLPNEHRLFDEAGRLTEIDYQCHNPDLGLPSRLQDPRWLRAMLDVSISGDGLRSRLMEKLLSEAERQAIQATWKPLNERRVEIQRLEANPKTKEAAATLQTELEKDLIAALATALPGGRGLTVRSAITRSLDTLSTMAELFPSLQTEIFPLAARSAKPGAEALLRAELKRLVDLGVLIEEAGGMYRTVSPLDGLSAAERHYLRGVNLILLSHLLFPASLDRSPDPAWVDPRLSTPKPWRDVYRYDAITGKRLGWIRYSAGRQDAFHAAGTYLPEGFEHPEKSQPVSYTRNARGLLEWRAQ